MITKTRRIIVAAITFISICLGTAVVLEGTLRLFPDFVQNAFYRVSWGHWGNRSQQEFLRQVHDYNEFYVPAASIGFEKKEIVNEIEKRNNQVSSNVFRILVLGDSVSEFSEYVPDMQKQLAESYGDAVDMLNAGVMGYDTHMELEFLRLRGIEYRPDLVILQFNVNDYSGTPVILSQTDGSWLAVDRTFPAERIHPVLFAKSQVYKFIALSLIKLNKLNVDPEAMVKPELKQMHEYLEARNTGFLVVYFPRLDNDTEKTANHDLFLAIIRDVGLEDHFLDLTGVYEPFAPEEISIDPWHPNDKGSRIAAENTVLFINMYIRKQQDVVTLPVTIP